MPLLSVSNNYARPLHARLRVPISKEKFFATSLVPTPEEGGSGVVTGCRSDRRT